MTRLRNLPHEALYDILRAYDNYIYAACEDRRFEEGWQPVGIAEFYENEYQDVWLSRTSDGCFLECYLMEE